MTDAGGPPAAGEFECTLLGTGYGESIVMHPGGGVWIVVDSFAAPDKPPAAMRYLEGIGVEPAGAIAMVVATHWHDDHIRGIAQMLETCPDAAFCCAGALRKAEFLALAGALERNHLSAAGSGLRELHRAFSLLRDGGKTPVYALANRLVFEREGCRLWALSPGDEVFQDFLRSVGSLVPRIRENKIRIPGLSPNKAAVALWVESGGSRLLLGADLERQGWGVILSDSVRPAGRASVFKVPHHGSENANEPGVWKQLLEDEPLAVLTPWHRGARVLPTARDAARILRATPKAWITGGNPSGQAKFTHQNKVVERTRREMGVRSRRMADDTGLVRLRRLMDADGEWTVETFGDARRLVDYAA